MLNSKQRASLKSIMANENPVCWIGKEGVNPQAQQSVSQALTARELIKIAVLENCQISAREVATLLADGLEAEVVSVLGRKVILYKFNSNNKKHVLD